MTTAVAAATKNEALQLASDYQKKWEGLKRRLAKGKEQGMVIVERFMEFGLGVGTGVMFGLLDAKWPGNWGKIPKEAFFAVPLVIAGMAGLGGDRFSGAALTIGTVASALLTKKLVENGAKKAMAGA